MNRGKTPEAGQRCTKLTSRAADEKIKLGKQRGGTE